MLDLGTITLLQIENIGKIRAASISMNSNGELVRIAGPNESGKSTVLDSIAYCLEHGGNIRNDAITHGQTKGTVRMETSTGYEIKRTIKKTADGQKTELSVKYNGAPITKASDLIKALSAKFMDPDEISGMTGREVLNLIRSFASKELEKREKNVEYLKAQARDNNVLIRNMGEPVMPTVPKVDPINSEEELNKLAILETVQNLLEAKREDFLLLHQKATQDFDVKNKRVGEIIIQIETLQKELEAIKDSLPILIDDIKAIDQGMIDLSNQGDNKDEIAKIKENLSKVSVVNANAQAWKDYETKRAKIEELDKANVDIAKCMNDEKAMIYKEVEKIVPAETGIKIDDMNVSIGDAPWEGASTSQKLVASATLCASTIPEGGVRVLFIKRGESLGKSKREILAKFAKDHNVNIVMEVMDESGMSGSDVVTIFEGEVSIPEERTVEKKESVSIPNPFESENSNELF